MAVALENVEFDVLEDTGDMDLLRVSGYTRSSRKYRGHYRSLVFLRGEDDAGSWVIRVPPSIETIEAALAWLTPKDAHDAEARGLRVVRQGPVYAVECADGRDRTAETAARLPAGHEWRASTRYLVHRPTEGRRYRPVKVGFPARFVKQREYRM